MRVVGHGVDIVDVADFARLLEQAESDFLDRCFTEEERRSVMNQANATQRLAGKFALKEAVAKALRTGFDGSLAPCEILVLSQGGAPTVRLVGGAAVAANALNVSDWSVSISHTNSMAIGSAIAQSAS